LTGHLKQPEKLAPLHPQKWWSSLPDLSRDVTFSGQTSLASSLWIHAGIMVGFIRNLHPSENEIKTTFRLLIVGFILTPVEHFNNLLMCFVRYLK
jgi:hypothetical protein